MNPFKKHKEKKAAKVRQADDARLQMEQKFDAAIEKAGQIEDPATKIMALNKAGNEILSQVIRETREISDKAENAQKIPDKLSWPLWYGSIGAFLFVAGPPGWIAGGAALAGSVGSNLIGRRRKKTTKQKLQKASDSHLKRLHDQATRSYDMAVEVAGDGKNVEAISQSPLKDKVLALPGIADKFAEAAKQYIVDAKAAVEAEKVPPAEVQKPAPMEQKLKFNKIINAFKPPKNS